MGKISAESVDWTSTDAQWQVHISYDGQDYDDRPMYYYSFAKLDEEQSVKFKRPCYIVQHSAWDLKGGVRQDIDAIAALETLAGFLTTWQESLEYSDRTGRDGENVDLFPATVFPFVDNEYHTELLMDVTEPETQEN